MILLLLLQAITTHVSAQTVLPVEPPKLLETTTLADEQNDPILLAEKLPGNDFFDLDGRADDQADEPQNKPIQLPEELEQAAPVPTAQFSPEMTGMVRWLILKNLPPTYEDKKKWGKQKQVIDGLHVEMKGLKIDTHRRFKMVNHGTWTRYFVELKDPENELQVQLVNLTEPRPGVIQFETIIEAPLHVFGRYSRYQWDVQLISMSANADARVRMTVQTEVELVVQPLTFPPKIEIRPKVLAANAELLEFKIRNISQLKGPVARALGDSLENVLRERLDDYDQKLTDKMNAQLAKQKDKLIISSDAWTKAFSK